MKVTTPSGEQIERVSRLLSEWNPLGSNADTIPDLNGYRIEAEDILFDLDLSESKTNLAQIVRDVMNQAFDLSLSIDECRVVAGKIAGILKKK
jgi:hypothetical protein